MLTTARSSRREARDGESNEPGSKPAKKVTVSSAEGRQQVNAKVASLARILADCAENLHSHQNSPLLVCVVCLLIFTE